MDKEEIVFSISRQEVDQMAARYRQLQEELPQLLAERRAITAKIAAAELLQKEANA